MDSNAQMSDVVAIFSNMVKARILIDFTYYRYMDDLITFKGIWCYNEVLCSVFEGNLIFA